MPGFGPASAPVASCGVLGFLEASNSYKIDYSRVGWTPLLRQSAVATPAVETPSLTVDKLYKSRDNLIRRFFHEPVPGVTNDHALNILCHKLGLLNQEFSGSFLARQNQHRHR